MRYCGGAALRKCWCMAACSMQPLAMLVYTRAKLHCMCYSYADCAVRLEANSNERCSLT